MKLAFYAYYKSFDFYRIGGTDSFLRRLAFALSDINKEIKIEYLLYGNKNEVIEINKNLKLIYIKDFDKSLEYIANNKFNHIVSTWLLMKDRKKFYQFSINIYGITKFHNILFFYPDTFLKKIRKFYELMFFKNNGTNFIVSKRQRDIFKFFEKKLTILNPPIDKEYFIEESLIANKKIKITFLGRIDPRKGIDKVISIFKQLEYLDKFEFSIHGIYIKEDEEATKIHNYLKNQNKIEYIEVEREQFSNKIDQMVIDVLKETDIFIQPYKNLDSTVDSPLLILEAMATNCTIITTKIKPVIDMYGNSSFLLDYDLFEQQAINLLSALDHDLLQEEKKRIINKKGNLYELFESNNVAKRFLNVLK